jgi:hypothetical protein
LKVEFASATSENNDDNEGEEEEQPTTDVTTDGEEEVGGDGDVQQEGATEEDDEDEDGGADGEQEQFASVVGEICDDFEDNDGDGFIDLADTDCAAGPLTQGALTAPTTPQAPPSVTNTTATNSTANTLTASGITAGAYDLEKDCESYEDLKIPPPPPGFGQPPDAKWYHCPPGVGVWVGPDGTTGTANSGTGQSSPTQTADTIAPSIVAPSFTVEADSEEGTQVFFTVAAHDTVDGAATLEEDGVTVTQDSVGGNIAISCAPNSGGMFPVGVTNVQCSAVDQAGNTREHSFTITVSSSSSAATSSPPQTLQALPPSTTTSQGQQQPPPNSAAQAAQGGGDAAADAGASGGGGGVVQGQQQPNSATTTPQTPPTTTTPQGGEQGQQPPQSQQQVPGTTSPDSSTGTTIFPDGISIAKGSDGKVYTLIPDKDVAIQSGPNGVEYIARPNVGNLWKDKNGVVGAELFKVGLPGKDQLRLHPDGTGEIKLEDDGTTITGNPDGTLAISKPVTDPNTGVKTEGATVTTTYKAP